MQTSEQRQWTGKTYRQLQLVLRLLEVCLLGLGESRFLLLEYSVEYLIEYSSTRQGKQVSKSIYIRRQKSKSVGAVCVIQPMGMEFLKSSLIFRNVNVNVTQCVTPKNVKNIYNLLLSQAFFQPLSAPKPVFGRGSARTLLGSLQCSRDL